MNVIAIIVHFLTHIFTINTISSSKAFVIIKVGICITTIKIQNGNIA